ncbi:GlxA family transcriptional regulator [Burkholderia gladioli]|uniref:GlxA family transcriptional regulator n=1 Tax=Burkholderia gladioli TaxID=28095 RepID=A0AAW3F221_BURGA|nr:GlxA family transcriptional regulator [Burkholderia gladioli]AJW93995.1 helix-turn-helix domain protein [Burkholderia gladioli]ASD82586.1 AraC family transcriptional regulator [Burkholderia gladioli pv. gladioli]AWY50022.1 AraC family transcriptional regulator [Burkholderia gladioli pv. gladioli]KGC13836.1 helix-turn-helix domain protein [Burkholderia gladioli]MBU9175357.1 GlxA family transcriptional regulator [Burkholderia gladioli]
MSKTIAILAVPGVQLLDVSGPLDVFAQANVEAGKAAYRMLVLACEPGHLVSSSGARLVPDGVVGEALPEIHTLLVAGAPGIGAGGVPVATLDWLRAVPRRCKRFGSVCTGALVLAEAGLLDGRRATTHWASVEALAERCPSATVEADALYVRDGRLRTAAGVTAGLDLALALVEEDLGREIAMRVASQLVMFFKRPGGQLQFSRNGTTAPAGRSVLQDVQRWVATQPELDHSVTSLAGRAGLSPRHFARLFHAEVGVTPAAWVELARVNAARALIETAGDAPKQVAAKCGFANADVLRRAFVKHVGVTPAEYRKRYRDEER